MASGATTGSSLTQWRSSALGGSRSRRWTWAVPSSLPVGALNGGWHTNTWAAMLTTQSGWRIWASASATVAVGPSTISSGVIMPPAVACS